MIGVILIRSFEEQSKICIKQLETLFEISKLFDEIPTLKSIASIAFDLYQSKFQVNLSHHKDRFVNLFELEYLRNILIWSYVLPTKSGSILVNFDNYYNSLINHCRLKKEELSGNEMINILFKKEEIQKIVQLDKCIPFEIFTSSVKADSKNISIQKYLEDVEIIYYPIIKNISHISIDDIIKLFCLEEKFSYFTLCHICEYNDKYALDKYDWNEVSSEFHYNVYPFVKQLMPIYLKLFSKEQVKQIIMSSIYDQINMTRRYLGISKSKVVYSRSDYLKKLNDRVKLYKTITVNYKQIIRGLENKNMELSNVQALVDSIFNKIEKVYNVDDSDFKSSVKLNCAYQFILCYKKKYEKNNKINLENFKGFDVDAKSKREDKSNCEDEYNQFIRFIDTKEFFPYVFNYFNVSTDNRFMTNVELAFSLMCFDHNLAVNENNRFKIGSGLKKSDLYLHLDNNFIEIYLSSIDKKIINYLYSSLIKPYLEKKNNIYTMDNPRALSLYRIVNEQLLAIIKFKIENDTIKDFYESTCKKLK